MKIIVYLTNFLFGMIRTQESNVYMVKITVKPRSKCCFQLSLEIFKSWTSGLNPRVQMCLSFVFIENFPKTQTKCCSTMFVLHLGHDHHTDLTLYGILNWFKVGLLKWVCTFENSVNSCFPPNLGPIYLLFRESFHQNFYTRSVALQSIFNFCIDRLKRCNVILEGTKVQLAVFAGHGHWTLVQFDRGGSSSSSPRGCRHVAIAVRPIDE